jgi:hypothetical protein
VAALDRLVLLDRIDDEFNFSFLGGVAQIRCQMQSRQIDPGSAWSTTSLLQKAPRQAGRPGTVPPVASDAQAQFLSRLFGLVRPSPVCFVKQVADGSHIRSGQYNM